MLQKISISKISVSVFFPIKSKITEKYVMVSTKISSGTNVFNIDNKKYSWVEDR